MAERFEFKPEATYGGIVVPKKPLEHQPIQEAEYWRMPRFEDYSLPGTKKNIQTRLGQKFGVDVELDKPPKKLAEKLEVDYAVPLFQLLKNGGHNSVTATIQGLGADELQMMGVAEARQHGSYLNIKLDEPTIASEVLAEVEALGPRYGEINLGNGKTVVFDTSSPNIAKEMTVAHLRSTVIGESLARMYQNCGYTVIRDNHLGDWGTQFGILGKAYELWGHEVPELSQPGSEIKGLLELYIRMNQAIAEEEAQEKARDEAAKATEDDTKVGGDGEASENEFNEYQFAGEDENITALDEASLRKQGLEWFARLESGDPAALELWQWAKDISLLEAERIYRRLGSNFEYVLGESEYVGMIPSVINALKTSGLAQKHKKGGIAIDLSEHGLKKLRIQKSDGTSLYATRDLATLAARSAWFNPEKIIYVVGGEQQDYFNHVFKAFEDYSKKVGEQAPKTEHVYFGMVKLPEGKMSTRKGNVIFLEEVMDEAVERAKKVIVLHTQKSKIKFSPEEIDDIAEKIGIGAVIYSELRQGRTRNIDFDWDEALSFNGNSGPYLQYTNARINSLFRNLAEETIDNNEPLQLNNQAEAELALKLGEFPDAIASAVEKNEPSVVAKYLYDLSSAFNSFYNMSPIAKAKDPLVRNTRLRLSRATSIILERGMYLLGMPIPEKM